MGQTFYYNGIETIGKALTECLVNAGFSQASSMQDAQFVFTYHPLLSQLEDAYFGGEGYLACAQKGTCFIDVSPATPELTREIAAVCAAGELFYVEAPVSVVDTTLANAFAQKSNVTCFLAGDKPDVKRAQKLLQHFAETITVTGEPGSAQLAHAQNTLQRAASILAAIEAEALYRAYLRNPATAAVASAAGVHTLSNEQAALVAAVAEKRFAGTYTTEMFMADLSAALTCAQQADLTLPQADACMNLLELLAIIGGSDLAPAALALIYDEEEAAKECGLDWSRTQEYTLELGGHEHEHEHDNGKGSAHHEFGHYTFDPTEIEAEHAHHHEDEDSFDDDFSEDFDSDYFELPLSESDFEDYARGEGADADSSSTSSSDDDDDDFTGYADLIKHS